MRQRLTQLLRMAADIPAAVAEDIPAVAVVVDMPAAVDVSNLSLLH
jgi:hypothetical protein